MIDAFTAQELEKIIKLMVENKIDHIKLGDIEIKKSLHLTPDNAIAPKAIAHATDEELYWSSTN